MNRDTGRLVKLPDAPFLVGELSPADALAGLVDGPVLVDNDVNWAARAERSAQSTSDGPLDDFAYLHLGEGLGCATVADGDVRRGHSGIAGEIAHLVTAGPGGRATAFTDVFEALGLHRPGTTAIDVAALGRAVAASPPVLAAIAEATCGVLAALVALGDPRVVLVGGEWGRLPAVLAAVDDRFGRFPRHVPVRPARVTAEPALAGAREHALGELRSAIVALRAQ